MDRFFKFSLLALLAGLASCHRTSSCSDKALQGRIEGCFLPLYTVVASTGLGQMQFEQLSDNDVMDFLCSQLDQSTTCMQNELEQCHTQAEVTDTIIRTLTETFGYACGEGRQALLEEASCWQNPKLEATIIKCEKQSQLAAMSATAATDVCSIMEDYKMCIQREVTSLCSENAGIFMYNVLGHATAEITSQMGCHANLVHTRAIFGFLARRSSLWK